MAMGALKERTHRPCGFRAGSLVLWPMRCSLSSFLASVRKPALKALRMTEGSPSCPTPCADHGLWVCRTPD